MIGSKQLTVPSLHGLSFWWDWRVHFCFEKTFHNFYFNQKNQNSSWIPICLCLIPSYSKWNTSISCFFCIHQAQEINNGSSSFKKKAKYVNLYTKEGQDKLAVMLPGRHVCECLAQKHKLINNCLTCGRIVCEQEGSGPCLFCGTLVCSYNLYVFPVCLV